MSSPISFLEEFLAKRLVSRDKASIIVVSKEPETLRPLHWPTNTQWLTAIDGADCVDMSLRSDLGVVCKQLEYMPSESGRALLARLRDCHCAELLVHDTGNDLAPQDMRALGFTRVCESDSGRWHHYARDEFYEERTWNSPEQWAHPQNYKRYRW
tara:strand:- start:316 stop:780 length:465 start_codon:yes stop_codon:yes gene_type:complete